MKKYLLLLSVVIMGLSACKKGDVTTEQAVVDDAKIQAYIKGNYATNIFTKDASGLYYAVIKQGTGAFPTPTSSVQIAYTGRFLNGAAFDQNANVTYSLSQMIKGWQIGLLKLKAGTVGNSSSVGRIVLIIPSALAYGPVESGTVPANSVLVFTIDLIGLGA